MKRFDLLVALFSLLLTNRTIAQNSMSDLDNVMLPTPNVSAMERFGGWPTGNYTGTPVISIPLFDIKSGDLTLPVSLSYNSGGIKINEIGSDVGIGWKLNAAGFINRTIMGGEADEKPQDGYWDAYPVNVMNLSPDAEYDRIEDYTNGLMDAQPDVFFLHTMGISEEFLYDYEKNVHLIPYKDLLINGIISPSVHNDLTGGTATNPITGFKVIDENGVEYDFMDDESDHLSQIYYYANNDNFDPVSPTSISDPLSNPSNAFVLTWHLSSMISPDRKDTIAFIYENNDISYKTPGMSEIQMAKQISGNMPQILPYYKRSRTVVYTHINAKVIDEIVFRGGYIKFYHTTDRKDMITGKRLDSIVEYDTGNGRIKAFTFSYQYLRQDDFVQDSDVVSGSDPQDLRLFLHSVEEFGNKGSSSQPYVFSYQHDLGLPSKKWSGGDTWGFANGKIWACIADSITSFDYDNLGDALTNLEELHRPNFKYAEQGILTQIQYPTGGYTTFDYEPYYQKGTPDSISIPEQVCDGGVNFSFYGGDFDGKHIDPDLPPKSFHVTQGTSAMVTTSLNDQYANFPTYYYIEIRDSASDSLVYTFRTSALSCDEYTIDPYPVCKKNLQLAPGTYYILPKNDGQIYPGGPSDIYCNVSIPSFNCRTEYVSALNDDTVEVGGVRLNRMIDFDPSTGSTIAKDFEYNSGIGFGYKGDYLTQKDYHYFNGDYEHAQVSEETQKSLFSSSLYPLENVMGSYIGYGRVKETKTDLNTGKIDGYSLYFYTNEFDDAPHAEDYHLVPYPPYIVQRWIRGMLWRKSDYKVIDTDTALVNDDYWYYSELKRNDQIPGEAFYQQKYYLAGSVMDLLPVGFHEYLTQDFFIHKSFSYLSSYKTLDSVSLRHYDGNGKMLYNNMIYSYDTTTLLRKSIQTFNSKGDKIITHYTYPLDYPITASPSDNIAKGVQLLQNLHILSAPIEEYTQLKANDSVTTLSATLNTYNTDMPLPNIIYSWKRPLMNSLFYPAVINSSIVIKDNGYEPHTIFNSYDEYGNILSDSKSNDAIHSYIWDYSHTYPVAEAINAMQSDIAYTSFEADGKGNWAFAGSATSAEGAITGGKAYSLTSGAISKSGLSSSRRYIISYWLRSGGSVMVSGGTLSHAVTGKQIGEWTCHQVTLSGATNVTLTGTAYIDELRLYPSNAEMTTYTYEPIIGMTSQCSAADRITYYDYDGLGRLQDIKDEDGNIIKTYEYHYKSN